MIQMDMRSHDDTTLHQMSKLYYHREHKLGRQSMALGTICLIIKEGEAAVSLPKTNEPPSMHTYFSEFPF